jgi:hypothetical protein
MQQFPATIGFALLKQGQYLTVHCSMHELSNDAQQEYRSAVLKENLLKKFGLDKPCL